jgi:hypothetical protein
MISCATYFFLLDLQQRVMTRETGNDNSREKFPARIRHDIVTGMSIACVVVPNEAFIREAFLFLLHLVGMWCINVSLGAKWRRGEKAMRASFTF